MSSYSPNGYSDYKMSLDNDIFVIKQNTLQWFTFIIYLTYKQRGGNEMKELYIVGNKINVDLNITGTPTEVIEELNNLIADSQTLTTTKSLIEVTNNPLDIVKQSEVRRTCSTQAQWKVLKEYLADQENVIKVNTTTAQYGYVYSGIKLVNQPTILEKLLNYITITNDPKDKLTTGYFKQACKVSGINANATRRLLLNWIGITNIQVIEFHGTEILTGVKAKDISEPALSEISLRNKKIIQTLDTGL